MMTSQPDDNIDITAITQAIHSCVQGLSGDFIVTSSVEGDCLIVRSTPPHHICSRL